MNFSKKVVYGILLAAANPTNALVPQKQQLGKPTLSRLNFQSNEEVQQYFSVVREGETSVLEAPLRQDNVKMYIAIDSAGFDAVDRPGNGGIRLLHYASDQEAIDDAVRLAQGMTRKHDQFRTGFSGAKIVVHSNDPNLENIQRKELMEDAAEALHVLSGSVYTGCDLNTCDTDMDFLTEATNEQYVLAGRNSRVDTNVATASSVIGSILGMLDAHEEDISKLTFTVQGCGKVGSTVAKELVRLGAGKVQTCDIFEEAANLQGCHPLAPGDWATTPTDFLVPCANSLAITEDIARDFPDGVKYCTGATNSPFASDTAKQIFAARGVCHVPESISSAGAILADSVEFANLKLYQTVEPSLLYGWVTSLSQEKARRMTELAGLDAKTMLGNVDQVTPGRQGDPIGESFEDYIEENTIKTDTLIIGGGMAGTATAFGLSQKGQSSVLVEQSSSIAPPTASSSGDSRMYRQMYSSKFFSRMQTTALKRWKDVEELTGETLLQRNGLLFYGEDTGETVEGSVLGAKQTMEELNLPFTFYKTGDEIAEAFPALAGCKGQPYSGVCEDTAGHIKASKACAAMLKAAGESCEVKVGSKICALNVNNEDSSSEKKIVAHTEDGTTILADHAVIACGAWTNDMLELAGLKTLDLNVWEIHWAHYKIRKDAAETIPQAFHFRNGVNEVDGGLYYVFPASATESVESDEDDEYTYVKVGVDFETPKGDLKAMSEFSYDGDDRVRKLMDEWVREHLPAAEERIDSYTSPYTMTADSYFVMDKIAPAVSIFSGGSGRAFKFAPTIGDMMASLVTGDESPVDLSPFAADREALALN